MRQTAFGDPSLCKQVRMMVGSLAAKVDRWRNAIESVEPWDAVARASLYRHSAPADSLAAAEATRGWWKRLQDADDAAILKGRIR